MPDNARRSNRSYQEREGRMLKLRMMAMVERFGAVTARVSRSKRLAENRPFAGSAIQKFRADFMIGQDQRHARQKNGTDRNAVLVSPGNGLAGFGNPT